MKADTIVFERVSAEEIQQAADAAVGTEAPIVMSLKIPT
jgi:hypothetical protein